MTSLRIRRFPAIPKHTCGPNGYCRACSIEDLIDQACERIADRQADYAHLDIAESRWAS